MAAGKTKSGGQDRQRIDIDAAEELRNWAKTFVATPAQIKGAFIAVGDSAADFERDSRGSHVASNADAAVRGDAVGKSRK